VVERIRMICGKTEKPGKQGDKEMGRQGETNERPNFSVTYLLLLIPLSHNQTQSQQYIEQQTQARAASQRGIECGAVADRQNFTRQAHS
jgi:hypothetical protein